jgi:hypothetical protein
MPYNREFSVKKIFFDRKIPRVESFRGSIHHTSVPLEDRGVRTINKEVL